MSKKLMSLKKANPSALADSPLTLLHPQDLLLELPSCSS